VILVVASVCKLVSSLLCPYLFYGEVAIGNILGSEAIHATHCLYHKHKPYSAYIGILKYIA